MHAFEILWNAALLGMAIGCLIRLTISFEKFVDFWCQPITVNNHFHGLTEFVEAINSTRRRRKPSVKPVEVDNKAA